MTTQEKVQQWIDNGEEYNSGLLLLSEIGKVMPQMIRIMTNRPNRYADKLKYELLKASGLYKQETVEAQSSDQDTDESEKDTMQKAAEFLGDLLGEKIVVAQKQVSEKSSPEATENEKREDWKDKPSAGATKNETYPAEVEKVKSEYSRLYNLRAQQHGLMTDVTPDNAPANVKKRKVLSDSIAEISQRLELLYAAKELYFENGTIPDIDALFGEVKKTEQAVDELPNDIAKLKAMKKSLQINIHKAKNKLEYQEETKQKRSNPMPEGPKRLDLEKTIEEREKEIERIEFKIVEIAHTR